MPADLLGRKQAAKCERGSPDSMELQNLTPMVFVIITTDTWKSSLCAYVMSPQTPHPLKHRQGTYGPCACQR